jgi:hypothetical protein
MSNLATEFNSLLHERPFSDWLQMQPSDYAGLPWSSKWGEAWEERKMTTELKTSKRADGSGFGEVIRDGLQVVRINWRGDGGATPSDVIRLTITRMEDEQRGGPFADPRAAKALALMLQADRELRGDQTSVDGVPIIGD